MNKVSVIGVDLAKNVFQLHGVDGAGHPVLRKQLKRGQKKRFFANLPPCLIGMEACGSAHYWARTLEDYGHEVRLMAPSFVKPYVKSNKNDRNDAEAICEAVTRPHMRFVAVKTPEQQAVFHLHHGRRQLVKQRVALSNHMRGVLLEFGIALPPGDRALKGRLGAILEDGENGLPMIVRQLLHTLWKAFSQLEAHIGTLTEALEAWHRGNAVSQRLAQIPGIGVQTATALAAVLGDQGADFRNGRQLAAYLGLVPRQSSSGGKERLLGISKRGDAYLRSLLIHGARAVIRHVRRRLANGQPGGNPWVEQLLARSHPNEVAVALANKLARTAWAVVAHERTWQADWQGKAAA